MLKLLLTIITMSLVASNTNAEDVYIVMQEKAYKAVQHEDGYLATNEYTPVSGKGFTDDYFTSKKYFEARHANNLLFKIRQDKMHSQLNGKGER